MKHIFYTLLIYVFLTAVTTAAMHDFSFRHSLFLLVDAILLVAGGNLQKEKKWYYTAVAYIVAILSSAFIIRFLTPATLRIWDVNTYLSFCFAVGNVLLIPVSILPASDKLKNCVLWAGSLIIFLPVVILWGYYFSESSWLNVDGLMALMQTNTAEAVEYLQDKLCFASLILISLYLLLTVVTASFGGKLNLKRDSRKLYAATAVIWILNAVLMIRTGNNFLISPYLDAKHYQAKYNEYIKVAETRKQQLRNILKAENTGEPGIYVLVIGESQNRTRMSAYGYHLETTPWLKEMKQNKNLLLFQNAYSCHVQTVPALTYALTAKNQYNSLDLKDAVSLIEMANAAGYQTVWLSNQMRYGLRDTPVTVIAGAAGRQIWVNSHIIRAQDTEYYDEELVRRLQKLKRSDKMLIVIHLMGNHLVYHKRYPVEYNIFKGGGKRSEYDNSILYNDYVMEELVKKVSSWPDFKGLVYFSDHSEEVENSVGHNPDTFMFDMTYIPLYMYFSEDYQKKQPRIFETLRAAQNYYFTNDLIFNVMLGIMDIQNKDLYEPDNDLTSPRYDPNLNRFMTLFGKRKIKEDVEEKQTGGKK